MKRTPLHLLLLFALLGYTSGAALAAHEAAAHHDHDHADRDCPVYQALTSCAIDTPPIVPAIIFDTAPRFTLAPIDETAPRLEPIATAQPRAPPAA